MGEQQAATILGSRLATGLLESRMSAPVCSLDRPATRSSRLNSPIADERFRPDLDSGRPIGPDPTSEYLDHRPDFYDAKLRAHEHLRVRHRSEERGVAFDSRSWLLNCRRR